MAQCYRNSGSLKNGMAAQAHRTSGSFAPRLFKLLAEALKDLTDRRRNVVLSSYFLDMSDADIAKQMHLVRSTVNEHKKKSIKILKKTMEGLLNEKKK